MLKKIKANITNADGTLNKGVLTGLISSLILLAQQVIKVFGIDFGGNWEDIQNLLNTILSVLVIIGVVSAPKDKV